MKNLNIDAVEHEVEIYECDTDDYCRQLSIKIGKLRGEERVTKKQAAALGKWFTTLAAEMK